ncbi:MAG TPA: cytochrome c oxidase assembly protein [Verrucomicrobiae bacterium]|jgi:cytochrome c oxidase assembly factor CtaG
MSTKEYLMSAWSWNPIVIGACAIALVAYAGLAGFKWRARSWYFLGAVAIFFLTLASPLNALANGFLFSAHMLQHMLLLLIVPLLLLLGLPEMGAGFRAPPWLHWFAGVSAMWIWHERTLCDLATRTETVRVIQIISLLALGALFWWPLAGPVERRRMPPLRGVAYLFSACIACSVLGIFIAFSPAGAVCPVYLNPPNQPALLNLIRHDWGFTPARDQQTGGLLMWVPGCGIYLAGILALLARWYGSVEKPEASPAPFLPAHPNAEEH